MQNIIDNSIKLVSQEARDVLLKNGLNQAESLEPWIIGIKSDFPTENISVLHDLKDFIVNIRKGMISALKHSSPNSEITEVEKQDKMDLQDKYENLLAQNSKASEFVKKRGLSDVRTVLKRFDAGDFGRESFSENGKNIKGTREYLQFYDRVLLIIMATDTETIQGGGLPLGKNPFVTNHQQKYGITPMFFILYEYLMATEDMNDIIFARFYGVTQKNIPDTKEEIAKDYRITEERVRQIANSVESNGSALASIKASEKWKQYPILNRPCIVDIESDQECLSIRQQEHDIPDTVIIAALALNNYKIKYIYKDKVNYKLAKSHPQSFTDIKSIALNNKLDGFKFQTVINEICESCNRPPKNDTVVPILTRYVTNASYWTNEKIPDLMDIEKRALADGIKQMIAIFCPTVIIENDEIYIAGIYDYSPEIEAILTENGNREPIPFANIMERLLESHPDEIRFKDPDRFSYLIKKYNQLEVIGKTRRVAMKEWGFFPKGIPELVKDVLAVATIPLSNDQIKEAVKARNNNYLDENTWNSVQTALSNSHYHLEDSETRESYYLLDDSRDFDHKRFRVWKKESEKAFDDYVFDFEWFCKKYGKLPRNFGHEQKRYEFFDNCKKTKEFIEKENRYPAMMEENINTYRIEEIPIFTGYHKLCKLMEFAELFNK